MEIKILENLIENSSEFEFNDYNQDELNKIASGYIESDEYNNNQLYFVLDDDDLVYALLYDNKGNDDFDALDYATSKWGCTASLYFNEDNPDNRRWTYL